MSDSELVGALIVTAMGVGVIALLCYFAWEDAKWWREYDRKHGR